MMLLFVMSKEMVEEFFYGRDPMEHIHLAGDHAKVLIQSNGESFVDTGKDFIRGGFIPRNGVLEITHG